MGRPLTLTAWVTTQSDTNTPEYPTTTPPTWMILEVPAGMNDWNCADVVARLAQQYKCRVECHFNDVRMYAEHEFRDTLHHVYQRYRFARALKRVRLWNGQRFNVSVAVTEALNDVGWVNDITDPDTHKPVDLADSTKFAKVEIPYPILVDWTI